VVRDERGAFPVAPPTAAQCCALARGSHQIDVDVIQIHMCVIGEAHGIRGAHALHVQLDACTQHRTAAQNTTHREIRQK